VVVVPAGHRLAGAGPVTVRDLADEPLIAPLATSAMRPPFERAFGRQGVEPRVVAEAATNEMVLELVRAGAGVTLATSSSLASVVTRGAVPVQVSDLPTTSIALVMRRGETPTPAAKAFLSLAVERAAELPD